MGTFESVLKQYLQFVKIEKGLAKNSSDSYENDLKRYLHFVSHDLKISNPGGITLQHIEAYLEELTELGLSVSTIARNISSIRSFHEFAVVEQFAIANPAELIELPKKARTLPEVLDAVEVERIIDEADRTSHAGIRDAAILETLYASGMRVSELTDLEMDRLFFEIGFIRVIGKGNKERLVPVGDIAQKAIEHYIETARKEFINQKNPGKAKTGCFCIKEEAR